MPGKECVFDLLPYSVFFLQILSGPRRENTNAHAHSVPEDTAVCCFTAVVIHDYTSMARRAVLHQFTTHFTQQL